MLGTSSHKKKVSIRKNGDYSPSKDLYLEEDWSFERFISAASERLGLPRAAVKRVFDSNGEEIIDCMMIPDNALIILSDERPFIAVGKDSEGRLKIVSSYIVLASLGKGRFGEVMLGVDETSGVRVALKCVDKAAINSLVDAEQAALESKVLKSLNHRTIMKVFTHLETPEHFITVFEMMDGGDLRKYLLTRGKTAAEAALPEVEARNVFSNIMSALSYAHANYVIHRDLKLENIFLLKAGSLEDIKIGGFNHAMFHRRGADLAEPQGSSLSFAAPEAFLNTRIMNCDAAAMDVWAAGVILFTLLCGRLPFDGPDLTSESRPPDSVIKSRIISGTYEIDEEISDKAQDLLKSMLCVDKQQRATMSGVIGHSWWTEDPSRLVASPKPPPLMRTRSNRKTMPNIPMGLGSMLKKEGSFSAFGSSSGLGSGGPGTPLRRDGSFAGFQAGGPSSEVDQPVNGPGKNKKKKFRMFSSLGSLDELEQTNDDKFKFVAAAAVAAAAAASAALAAAKSADDESKLGSRTRPRSQRATSSLSPSESISAAENSGDELQQLEARSGGVSTMQRAGQLSLDTLLMKESSRGRAGAGAGAGANGDKDSIDLSISMSLSVSTSVSTMPREDSQQVSDAGTDADAAASTSAPTPSTLQRLRKNRGASINGLTTALSDSLDNAITAVSNSGTPVASTMGSTTGSASVSGTNTPVLRQSLNTSPVAAAAAAATAATAAAATAATSALEQKEQRKYFEPTISSVRKIPNFEFLETSEHRGKFIR